MNKYISVFRISFSQEFAYKMNFVMWRVRNVIQILLVLYLWKSVFSLQGNNYFGYSESMMLTYIFGMIFVRAFVLSARAVDVAGEVSSGNLSNYLVKPVSYFRYWLSRDLASKLLNISFACLEASILFIFFKPDIYFQRNPLLVVLFILSLVVAIAIYFNLLFITSAVPFWMPEAAWGAQFLLTAIFVEFLSGGVFPLDVLPDIFLDVLKFTPFPYLIFFPIQVYLGKLPIGEIIQGLTISVIWVFVLYLVMKNVWSKGLKAYQSQGR